MIEIDGNTGGGQVLRTALSLSMVTGQPFTIRNIRGTRPKPGLMRQHLTCVKAAAEVSGANVSGAELGSQSLVFEPMDVCAGEYEFAIGSAGSTTLVFQTLLPALAKAGKSAVSISGGTHNPMAPTATFIEKAFLPAVASFGVAASCSCPRVGFVPAGGGRIECVIPDTPAVVEAEGSPSFEMLTTGLPDAVLERVCKTVRREFGECSPVITEVDADCIGGCCHLIGGGAVVSAIAEKSVTSERLATRLAKEMKGFLGSGAEYTPHLADQLMIYLALSGSGSITTPKLTRHIRSNAETVKAFLRVEFGFEQETESRVRIGVCER